MENLIETISLERQERLLNPQMSDHFRTFFMGKFGHRIYEIKIGRKWVTLRSNNHRTIISLDAFKTKAFVQWRRDCESFTFIPSKKRKREWYKEFGFFQNPREYILNPKHLLWK